MSHEIIEWGVAAQVREGESLSGDQYLVKQIDGRILVAVIDGIGHGPEAAEASRMAVAVLEAKANQQLVSLFAYCHKALHGTRGVVMSLAAIDEGDNQMTWLGVGNVEGRLLRANKTSSHPEETLLLRNGVVGHTIPSSLIISGLPMEKGDALILATDGIRHEFTIGLHIGRSAHMIANDILATHNKGNDDALVMVVKYRGGG